MANQQTDDPVRAAAAEIMKGAYEAFNKGVLGTFEQAEQLWQAVHTLRGDLNVSLPEPKMDSNVAIRVLYDVCLLGLNKGGVYDLERAHVINAARKVLTPQTSTQNVPQVTSTSTSTQSSTQSSSPSSQNGGSTNEPVNVVQNQVQSVPVPNNLTIDGTTL